MCHDFVKVSILIRNEMYFDAPGVRRLFESERKDFAVNNHNNV